MKNHAFTLIELLVVVLIIGILAAVALPQYQKAVNKTKVAEALTVLSSLVAAEEVYYLANGEYTAEMDNLDVSAPTSNLYIYSCNGGECHGWPKNYNVPYIQVNFSRANEVENDATSKPGLRMCVALYANAKAESICKNMTQHEKIAGGTHRYYHID